MSGADDLNQVLVVQCQDFLRDCLDTRVDQIEAVLARVDVCDDPVVDVNECFFSFLNTEQHAVQKFDLVHLVAAKVDSCLAQTARMLSDLHPSLYKRVHMFYLIYKFLRNMQFATNNRD